MQHFRFLSRIQQINFIIEMKKDCRDSYATICSLIYRKYGVFISVDEIKRHSNYIPTSGIGQRAPSQISTELPKIPMAITDFTFSRFDGKNSRKGQW